MTTYLDYIFYRICKVYNKYKDYRQHAAFIIMLTENFSRWMLWLFLFCVGDAWINIFLRFS